jgi:hypothetical protein
MTRGPDHTMVQDDRLTRTWGWQLWPLGSVEARVPGHTMVQPRRAKDPVILGPTDTADAGSGSSAAHPLLEDLDLLVPRDSQSVRVAAGPLASSSTNDP